MHDCQIPSERKLYPASNVKNYGRRQEALKILQKLHSYHSRPPPPQIFPISRGERIWSSLDWTVYKIQDFLAVVEKETRVLPRTSHQVEICTPLRPILLPETGGPLASLIKTPPFSPSWNNSLEGTFAYTIFVVLLLTRSSTVAAGGRI